MHIIRKGAARLPWALLALVIGLPDAAPAATFRVSPVQVFLSASGSSALLTLSNGSDETLRFQVTAFRWAEGERGEMELQPTEEIVVFPTLLTLEPGTERKIRVGSAAPRAASERTYRIFVEELPSAEKKPGEGSRVRVLTRMGIPIFLSPSKAEPGGEIEGARLENGSVSFLVRNSGNVHFRLQTVRMEASSASGETVLDRKVEGWYVLAGGSRRYEFELPPEECSRVRSVRIEAQTESGTFETRVKPPLGACGRTKS